MARLWLGLSEEWNKEIPGSEDESSETTIIDFDGLVRTESYQTARAAIGTLAAAASDPEVCVAILTENCATTVVSLLQSSAEELVHRALVFALNFVNTHGIPAAKHLLEGGVVPALHVGTKLSNSRLRDLCKEVGLALSAALKAEAEHAKALALKPVVEDVPASHTSGGQHDVVTDDSNNSRFEELD